MIVIVVKILSPIKFLWLHGENGDKENAFNNTLCQIAIATAGQWVYLSSYLSVYYV